MKEEKIDMDKIREFCCSKFGLVSNSIRKKVWPLLLSIDQVEWDRIQEISKDMDKEQLQKDMLKLSEMENLKEWINHTQGVSSEDQVQKDIDRSLNNLDITSELSKEAKNRRREVLKQIILAILKKNKDLHYFQGFNDFCSVFMLSLGDNLGFYCS